MNADTIYLVAREHLGDHMTLDPTVPEEVGCAEAVSAILSAAGALMPLNGIPSVVGLIDWMLKNGFQELPYPIAGAVITAHNKETGITNGSHCGICLKHGIGSNNSFGQQAGRFTENYSYANFESYFTKLGSEIRYFVPVDNTTCTISQ